VKMSCNRDVCGPFCLQYRLVHPSQEIRNYRTTTSRVTRVIHCRHPYPFALPVMWRTSRIRSNSLITDSLHRYWLVQKYVDRCPL